MEDYYTIQIDELEVLKAIYQDDFLDKTPDSSAWNKKPSPKFDIKLSSDPYSEPVLSLVLSVEFTSTYPNTAPLIKLLNPINVLSSQVACLTKKAQEITKTEKGGPMIYSIADTITECLNNFQSAGTTGNNESLEEERLQRLEKEKEKMELLEKQEQEKVEQEREKEQEMLDRMVASELQRRLKQQNVEGGRTSPIPQSAPTMDLIGSTGSKGNGIEVIQI
ncbi:unnamed protein product [Ambrosiozyma monospora]|uniref:Unnamed protein product n=1 Tax=Ambrosiozyma monospora TaxID=43982 RepID=A0ACB5T0P0_AMBMO|nr:unnamed protein product [Ambrosiozyma monospora]